MLLLLPQGLQLHFATFVVFSSSSTLASFMDRNIHGRCHVDGVSSSWWPSVEVPDHRSVYDEHCSAQTNTLQISVHRHAWSCPTLVSSRVISSFLICVSSMYSQVRRGIRRFEEIQGRRSTIRYEVGEFVLLMVVDDGQWWLKDNGWWFSIIIWWMDVDDGQYSMTLWRSGRRGVVSKYHLLYHVLFQLLSSSLVSSLVSSFMSSCVYEDSKR